MKLSYNVLLLNRRLHSSPSSNSTIITITINRIKTNPRSLRCLNITTNPNSIIMLPRTFIRFTSSSSVSLPSTNPLSFLLSFTTTSFHFNDSIYRYDAAAIQSKQHEEHRVFSWNRAPEGVDEGLIGGVRSRNRVATVLLLGWLGAEQKHLRRYAELYNAQGIHAVKFVVPLPSFYVSI